MVVFSFLKNYRNVSSILILLTHCSYFFFSSITITEFGGLISEFQVIASVVRTLNLTVYFLSQGHTDHMVGLNKPELFERIKHYNIKTFCHKVLAT